MSNYRYAFQGQELDRETGMEAFQLRLWDGRLGRWLSPDPYGQYFSPYLGMGNNPVGMVDPDGGHADWHYDDTGNLVADKGDNASTLATFLGSSLEHAQNLIAWNGFSDVKAGDKLFGMMYTLNEIAIHKEPTYYFDNYFKYYRDHPGPNPYSPYIPSGNGITISGSVDIHLTTYYASLTLAFDNQNHKAGGFFTAGAGLSTSWIGANAGLSFDNYDTYGGADLFSGLKGYSNGFSVSATELGYSNSKSSVSLKGKLVPADAGVITNSIFLSLKPGLGGNKTFSNTHRFF